MKKTPFLKKLKDHDETETKVVKSGSIHDLI
jgi:hypothetical protein